MVELHIANKDTFKSAHKAPFEEMEARYMRAMVLPLEQVTKIGEAEIVIGIPFLNEAESIPHVIKTAIKGIETYYPGYRTVIVAIGSPEGKEALEAIQSIPKHRKINRIALRLEDELLNGKGWCIRAIFEIAYKLGADVALIEADLTSRSFEGETEGLSPEWIRLLLEPIKSGSADVVVSRFNLHHFDSPVCDHLAYPLFSAIYNCPIRCLMGGQWGLAHHLLRTYLNNPRYAWETSFSGYGVDSWIATSAITNNARICEANLGIKIHRRTGGKTDLILRQFAKAFFREVLNDYQWWGREGKSRISLAYMYLPSFGVPSDAIPDPSEMIPHFFITKFQIGFNDYHALYEHIFEREAYLQLEKMARIETRTFNFPVQLWCKVVYDLLIAYSFGEKFSRGDVLNSLIPLHDGFAASKAMKLHALERQLKGLSPETRKRLISIEAEREVEKLADEFRRQRSSFVDLWDKKAVLLESPIPLVTYREFIPGVPLIVPTESIGRNGNLVTANGIYENIFASHKANFDRFIYGYLKLPREAISIDINMAIKDFLRSIDEEILPGSELNSIKGTEKTIQTIFSQFPIDNTYSLTPQMAEQALRHCVPMDILTKYGFTNLSDLLCKYDPCDILALARLTEDREYMEDLWDYLDEVLRPEHFTKSPIRFRVIKHENFPSLVELRNLTALDKLTSRIVVTNLPKGLGGEFPHLLYFLSIAKETVEAERFSHIWQQFAEGKGGFGRKVINSIRGHWGRDPLSAHNIFEDGNQRVLVDRLRLMASRIANEGNSELADKLQAMADSYHLSLIMPDGKFVTCSAWSWASYSFKGGNVAPPPLSIHVERDWASREFLVEYFKALGGSNNEVDEKIIELMAEEKESENLAAILLGTDKEVEKIVRPKPNTATDPEQPPAGQLIRFAGNPVLKPIKEHSWESKYVLNAGAIKLNDKVYLAYRAFGDDEVSRIGLAVSDDGFNFSERLPLPIFAPKGKHDAKGCEDPRLTLMGPRIYMAYTAYDGNVAQIALASICVEDFISYRWENWHRHGMVFPKFTDKDAVLFPEQFDGKYALLHRVDPHIWITFSNHLRCPWSRKEHKILAGATSGMMWDGTKIGAGTQAIKTKYGWLLITHSVDYARVYRLGVMLADLADPSQLIYRSPNYVLEPDNEWELGSDGKSWVSNVVFTCGAVPSGEVKDMLEAEDELIVYYGAADSVISAATAKISSLIPEKYRQL